MRQKRDFYTPLLPFDEVLRERDEFEDGIKKQSLLTSKESLLNIIRTRLIKYLAKENKLPTNFPILKLLPSLNKDTCQDSQIKFTEDQVAEFLKELGAFIEASPSYLGRSRYRVTISQDLADKLLSKIL